MQNYETPVEVLTQRLFLDLKTLLGSMSDNVDVYYRLNNNSDDTFMSCFAEAMDILRKCKAVNKTLASKHSDPVVGFPRHCQVHDSMAQQALKSQTCAIEKFVENIDSRLNIFKKMLVK